MLRVGNGFNPMTGEVEDRKVAVLRQQGFTGIVTRDGAIARKQPRMQPVVETDRQPAICNHHPIAVGTSQPSHAK
jgi:hypothetical protein